MGGAQMRLWVSKSYGYTPLMLQPSSGAKILDLNPNTVLTYLDEESGEYFRVAYVLSDIKNYVGWVAKANVEWYVETLPKNCVDLSGIQTPNPNDFEQYIITNGQMQYNMCGEMSVCYILDISLQSFLNRWQVDAVPLWKRIFGNGKARGTSDTELQEMMNIYGVRTELLTKLHKTYTPQTLEHLRGSIVSVRISPTTGRLNGGGILHWVVVEDVDSERMGYGTVTIYNPAPNRVEIYSYNEFLASARIPYGVKCTG